MNIRTVLSSLLIMTCVGATAQAEDFPSDTIRIVVPYGPGGGFDRAVRTFAPFLSEALGGADVITENIPGAGGQRGSTTVSRADPDGHTLGIFNLPGFALPSILGNEVGYNLRELSWIGRLESQNYVLLAGGDSDIHTVEDVVALDEPVFTSTGFGSTILASLQITANALGLEAKDPIYLSGYGGTSDSLVALVRGDGNLSMAPISSARSYIQSGDLRPIAVSGTSSPFEGVPTFADAGYPELTPLDLQRAIAGPPDLDPEVLAQLRAAFMEVVENPEFLAAAEQSRMNVEPLDGEAMANALNESFVFYEKFSASLANPN